MDPTDGSFFNEIAWGYQPLDNIDKALEYSEKSVEVWPGEPNPLDTMAFIYWRMGKLDDAIATYNEAINIKPDFWPSVSGISIVYAMKENYDDALKWIDTYISIASPYMRRDGYFNKGFYQSWVGNHEQSLLSFQRA